MVMKVSPSQPETRPHTRLARVAQHPAFGYLLVAGLTLAVFWPVKNFDFISYDDPEYVVTNPMVRNGLTVDGFLWAFKSGHAGNWHPITWLSHMLDTELTGTSPVGPHVVNLILHVANALLLLLFLRTLTIGYWSSLFVATLFALHPLHVESVAWISERKDVLSTTFGLLSLWAYARYAKSESQKLPAKHFYVLSLLCLALGLMSKPMLVTWPFVFILLDYWPLRRTAAAQVWRRLIQEKIPFFLLSIGSCIITFFVQRGAGAVATVSHFSPGARLGNVFVSYARYPRYTFWPSDLIIPNLLPAQPWPAIIVTFCAGLVVVLTLLAVRFRRQWPFAVVGWFWYLGMLVPVIGILQVGDQALADRYTYVPLIGVFIITAVGGAAIARHWQLPRSVTRALAALIIVACAVLSSKQLSYWRSSETLFRHTLSVAPNNSVAHMCLGSYLFEAKRTDESIQSYREAVRLLPEDPVALNGLGQALAQAKHYPEAMEYLQTALRLNPDSAEAHNNLGTVLADLGQPEAAIQHYEAAIRAKHNFIVAHYRLGNALMKLGRTDQAIAEYTLVVRTQPDSVDALNNLGVALSGQRKTDEATLQFRAALRFQPDNANTHFNLGNALAIQEKWADAAAQYSDAVRLAPTNAGYQYGCGLALARLGRREKAARHLSEALRLNPGDAKARRELQAIQGSPP